MTKRQRDALLQALLGSGIEGTIFNLSDDSTLQLLEKYIETHKWFLSERIPFTISCVQAVFSWYENVYRPLWYAMQHSAVCRVFASKDLVELFADLSDLHYELAASSRYVSYEAVCDEYIKRHVSSKVVRFLIKLRLL